MGIFRISKISKISILSFLLSLIVFISHRVYDAYLTHRQRGRSNSPGGSRRLYPTFRTNGGRIVPPEDVPSSSSPMFNNGNMKWAGHEVTQLRRSGDQTYYIGKKWFMINQFWYMTNNL